jgi:hypothetical protein
VNGAAADSVEPVANSWVADSVQPVANSWVPDSVEPVANSWVAGFREAGVAGDAAKAGSLS